MNLQEMLSQVERRESMWRYILAGMAIFTGGDAPPPVELRIVIAWRE